MRTGLLGRLAKLVLEGQITDHLEHDEHERSGNETGNTRNGSRSRTVLTCTSRSVVEFPGSGDSYGADFWVAQYF
ncbi:transposase [Nonomuraea salmonea]|uniref:transposase n=1 Tax=Nonomuraea salmonea TaxID=46181 RepID=UPI002FE747ED